MDKELWQRYINNTVSEEERKSILKWLQALDEDTFDTLLAEGWLHDAPPMPDAEALLVRSRVMQQAGITPLRVSYRKWWRVAAAVLLLAGSGFLWCLRPIIHQQAPALAVKWKQLRNNTTRISRITLPDSSLVWLTPQSQLEIPEDYPGWQRHIRLSGEAYFEVAPSSAAPFIVTAGNVQTTVLGTGFNIEAYPGESIISVALTRGKVAVKMPLDDRRDSTQLLAPGTKITYEISSHLSAITHFVSEDEAAWKRGALILDKVPVPAVFERLGKRFGKKIIFDPSRFNRASFSAKYLHPELDLVLKNMAFTYAFRYQVLADTIIIH